MRVSAAVIPVAQHAEARGFFAWVNTDGEPLVLSRQAKAGPRQVLAEVPDGWE